MTEKPLLSVILPVYNGEKYIDTIIEAFKNQTYKDFELIFIDDGSADGSYEKIHGYIGKTDFPIILRKQENKGVSAARNNGVKAASGKYIAFVDCDDDIVGDYVETLRDAEDSRFDVFVFQSLMTEENAAVTPKITNKNIRKLSRYEMLERFISDPTAFGVVNLFIDRDFYAKNSFEFREGYKYYEDYDFLYRIFSITDNILFSEYQMYFYIRRKNSAMARFIPDRLSCLTIIEELKPFIASNAPEFLPLFEKWAAARIYWSIMWQASLAFGVKDALRFAKRAYIKQQMRKLKDYPSKKVRLSSRLFSVSPPLFVLSAKFLGKTRSKIEKSDIEAFAKYFDNRPKKILVYGMTENRGGIESYIMNVYRNLGNKKMIFDFLTDWETMAFETEVKENGSKVFHIPAKSRSLFKHQKAIAKILKDHKEYRTVYFNILNAGAVFSMIPCFIRKRNIVVHSHSSSDSNMRLHNLCKLPLNVIAKKKLACSKPAAVYMFGKKALVKEKVKIINNAINVSDYTFSPSVRKEKRDELNITDNFSLIHVGRMSAEKNPIFIIDIFSAVSVADPTATLLYVGSGPLEEKIKKPAADIGIIDRIKFLGMRSDIPQLLQAADVFLLPSLFEGLPISLLEAQAADLPCFVSDNVSKEAEITDSVSFLSVLSPPDIWAAQIINARDAKRKNREKEFFDKGYDIKREADRVVEILNKI